MLVDEEDGLAGVSRMVVFVTEMHVVGWIEVRRQLLEGLTVAQKALPHVG